MDEDDGRVRPKATHVLGETLDALSIDELEERIAALEAEIGRLRAAIGHKSATRSAAEGFFKT
ncbi:MAG TPA: DUF1192 domain-containing protein [Devosiaceae bacterium]